ncbi:hypothetical protein VKT23_006318 [Stygiomarasmius scandens]|uniref:Zn(2)-C6 fungal-type domain-containing protein n=1 Tax=Marasmiellus scandens TaxID=2682957 RepID=A0ABR1JNS6_9AGAR
MKDKEKEKEKESVKQRRKPGRVPTACAECRRLKLRCDKKVPCEKCVSRGCEAICPDGSLTAGKGNRLVLSGTEELHERIYTLCSRIRELEEALASLQVQLSQDPHPLLRSDLLQLKVPHNHGTQAPQQNAHNQTDGAGVQTPGIAVGVGGPDGTRNAVVGSGSTSTPVAGVGVNGNTSTNANGCVTANGTRCNRFEVGDENFIDAFGTLSLDANGESSFLGKTARSEYLIRALSKPSHPQSSFASSSFLSAACARLPKKIIQMQSTCSSLNLNEDHQVVDLPEDYDDLGKEIFGLLPGMSEAIRLCEMYLEAGKYMYTPIPRKELLDEILAGVYRAKSFASLPQKHTLSLLFVIFALGALFDQTKPPYSLDAQEYFYLARAARNHVMSFSSSDRSLGAGASGVRYRYDDDGNDGEMEDDEGEDEDEFNMRDDRYERGRGGSCGSNQWSGSATSLVDRRGSSRGVGGRKARGGWGMSVTGLWTTIHMSQYLELSDWEALGSSSAWWFVGFSARLATSLGLHLNSARWKVPEEMQKKRALIFWQTFTVDTWLSFHYGRPPSLSRAYIDCPLPEDTEEVVGEDGKKQPGFHSWNFQYTFFMHTVIETAFGCNSPPYSVIIDIDRQIRDFPVPELLRPRCKFETMEELMAKGGRERVRHVHTLTMQRWMTMSHKESTLLNLHRAYFAQALQDSPNDLASHRYLPSVMATYRSAWRLIEALKIYWAAIPQMLERYNLAWSQALSAAIVMCILVTRSPNSKMTKSSLTELDLVVELFEDASVRCKSAANILETVQNLRNKAHEAVDQTRHLSELASSRLSADELDRLGGRTHLISSSSRSSRRHSKTSVGSSHLSSNSASPTSSTNYGTPVSQAGASPSAAVSSYPNHTSSDSFISQPSVPPQQNALPSSTSIQNQAENTLGFQNLFSAENMHPSIAHDLQILDIISDPTLSAGPGPWPLFYDLPTGIPSLSVGPTLPQYVPGPMSGGTSVSSRQTGPTGVDASYSNERLFQHPDPPSNPSMSDISFQNDQPDQQMDIDQDSFSGPSRTALASMPWVPSPVPVPPNLGDWPFLDDPSQSPLISGFSTGGFSAMSMNNSGPAPPILDATWQSFVEQLGF